MSKWRVYNRHVDGLTHVEKFRGDTIKIPAGEFVLMDYEDAVQFKGQYFPIKMDAQNVQDRSTYKMIEIKPHDEGTISATPTITKYVSHIDGKEFTSKVELEKYLEQFQDKVIVDEVLEEEIKRRPGRPPKEKSA